MTAEQTQLLAEFEVRSRLTTTWQGRLALLRGLVCLPVVPELRRQPRMRPTIVANLCWCCAEVGSIAWHHVIPVQCGGPSEPANFVPLCSECHVSVHAVRPSTQAVIWDAIELDPAPYGYPPVSLDDCEDYEAATDAYTREQDDLASLRLECAIDEVPL